MSCVLGIDGGGTKTSFLICSLTNGIRKCMVTDSICPRDNGIAVFKEIIGRTVSKLFENLDDNLVSICIGIPCFGEDSTMDKKTTEVISKMFPMSKVSCVNDCVVGYAGALGLEPGINIVAGTGAIAYGENVLGESARSNGWSSDFSDEGSCCWLGKKCFELFCKQADGRLPKMALYEIVKNTFCLQDDMEIIKVYEQKFKHSRREMATLQILLVSAAIDGDFSAIEAYSQAADELAISIEAVRAALGIEGVVPVSYAGGLFKTENIILTPLKTRLDAFNKGFLLREPLYNPETGAALLAAKMVDANIRELKRKIIEGGQIA